MGQPKSLLPLGDQPVIRRCLDSLQAAGVAEILVVLGHGAAELEKVLHGQPVTLLRNPDPASDMAGSVRVGLQHLSAETTGVLVCLVDHPLVSGTTLRTLLEAHRAKPELITIPTYQGSKGHPTLFPRPLAAELFQVPTLRDVVSQNQSRQRLVEVPDSGVVLDMDTPEDYRKALQQWKLQSE